MQADHADRYLLYICEEAFDITDPDGGISVWQINAADLSFEVKEHVQIGAKVFFACLDQVNRLLYVAADDKDPARPRAAESSLMVFEAPDDGSLVLLDTKHALPPGPSYMTLDASGQYLIVSYHTTHAETYQLVNDPQAGWVRKITTDLPCVVSYRLEENGRRIGDISDVAEQEGSGPLRTQTHAHPHSAVLSPDGRFVAVCDKGADKVFMYSVDASDGRFIRAENPGPAAEAGDEPRFCVFHPYKNILYCNHEGNPGVSSFSYDDEGKLTYLETIYTYAPDAPREPGRIYEHQGIAIHPEGKALYSEMRTPSAVAVIQLNKEGKMLPAGSCPVPDNWARCLTITKDGRYVIAGTLKGGEIVFFETNEEGMLTKRSVLQNRHGICYIETNRFR